MLDPIYGYITIPKPLVGLIDAPHMQRLRRISQTSLAPSVYPSMNGSRFEHALGAMHLTMTGWRHAWANSPMIHDDFRDSVNRSVSGSFDADGFAESVGLALGAVALLHDVGHTPFSHALEDFFREHAGSLFPSNPEVVASARANQDVSFHEAIGQMIATQLLESRLHPPEIAELAGLIYSAHPTVDGWTRALKSIVAGEIDCDRIDYLLRDARSAGTEYGAIDFQRLVSGLEIVRGESEAGEGVVRPFRVALGHRARSAAEQLLVARSQSYRWVYFHPRVVAADLALARACELLLHVESTLDEPMRRAIDVGFADVRPDLDFVRPSVPDAVSALVPISGTIDQRLLLEFEESEKSAASIEMSGVLAVGSDDGRVIEWLKNAYLLCHAYERKAPRAEAEPLMRIRRYIEVVLIRAKVFIPVWKNYEEYRRVAEKLRAPLREALQESYDSLVERQVDSVRQDAAKALRAQAMGLAHSREDVQILNWISGKLLRTSAVPLATHLDAKTTGPLVGAIGFWDCVFREFTPLKTGNQATTLVKDNELISLKDTSPLVSTLERVDEERVKLFVYFFVDRTTDVTVRSPVESRTALQDKFVRSFPEFVLANFETIEQELVDMAAETT